MGEALARHVIDRYRARGTGGVVLSSLAEMAAAHRLYERLGFRRTRRWTGPRCRASAHRLPPRPGARDVTDLTATLSFTVPTTTPRSRSAPETWRCSARRGCWPGARPRPAPPSRRRCPRAARASAPGSSSSTRRQRGRPRGRGDRRRVVRRRTAAPLHRRRPARRGRSRSWPPARSPGWSSTPSGSWRGSDLVELGRMAVSTWVSWPCEGPIRATRRGHTANSTGIRRWGACRGWRPSSCGRGAYVRSCSW